MKTILHTKEYITLLHYTLIFMNEFLLSNSFYSWSSYRTFKTLPCLQCLNTKKIKNNMDVFQIVTKLHIALVSYNCHLFLPFNKFRLMYNIYMIRTWHTKFKFFSPTISSISFIIYIKKYKQYFPKTRQFGIISKKKCCVPQHTWSMFLTL